MQEKIIATYDQEYVDGATRGIRILAIDSFTGTTALVLLTNEEARALVNDIEKWL